jgi:hypothetical protein
MRIVALICNIVLFGFTCLVLVVDGPPKGASYVVFTAWSLLTLILSAVVISRMGAIDGLSSTSTTPRIVATICNVVFLGFVCWALVDQYPHPEEDGVIAFTVLMVLTPILSLVALLRDGANDGWLGLHMKGKASRGCLAS